MEARSVKLLVRSDFSLRDFKSFSEHPASVAENGLKRMHFCQTEHELKYMDLSSKVAPSNICERPFSKAEFSLSDEHYRLLSDISETHIYLQINREYWGISGVHNIVS